MSARDGELDPSDYLSLRDRDEQMRFLLRFGLFAPSPLNSQPWLFGIKDTTLEVWGNARRALRASDPSGRQLFIGVGCAIENILVAADYYGLPVEVRFFPDVAERYLVARIGFGRLAVDRDRKLDGAHLVHAIAERRSNRFPYADRPVPQEFLDGIRDVRRDGTEVHVISDDGRREKLVRLVGEATEAVFRNRDVSRELARWTRSRATAQGDGLPASSVGIPRPLSVIASLLVRSRHWAASERRRAELLLEATPVTGIVATGNDEPRDWVSAGQALERVWLMATRAGLAACALAAPIEVERSRAELQDLVRTDARPQVFVRFGYSDGVAPRGPRLRPEAVIVR